MSSKFNNCWIDPELNPQWSPWLKAVPNDPFKAKCMVCHKTFELSIMGKRAVASHEKSTWHQKAVKDVKTMSSVMSYFQKNTAADKGTSSSAPQLELSSASSSKVMIRTTSTSDIISYLSPEFSQKAEVYWALRMVMNKQSFREQEGICEDFKKIFPDSNIAKGMHRLSRTKISYLVTYGLAPYFQHELKNEVANTPCIVVCFYESLNQIAQKEQMDQVVRYWDEKSNRVVTRYWTSVFMGHTTADDLVSKFIEGLEGVDLHKVLQISMDGPNVNWSFLKKLAAQQKKCESDPDILNLGSCGLHVIHGAVQTGHDKAGWEVQKFLKGIYTVFKHVPARRADFIRITGTTAFPKHFCPCRWLENGAVAMRALEILPHVKKFFASSEKLPNTQSVVTVKTALKDNLLPAKLAFFNLIAMGFEPFLKAFQTDKPMVPFLYSVLENILRELLARFISPEVLKNADTGYKLMTIKFEAENFITLRKIDIGITVEHELSKVKQLTEKQRIDFRKECRTFMEKTATKIIERSPLKYKLVAAAQCLMPITIVKKPQECQHQMKTCLNVLLSANHLKSLIVERANVQFKSFVATVGTEKLMKYNMYSDRLDELYAAFLSDKDEYKELWLVVKMILILSHGNASVESGFSINKSMLVENMHEDTLVSLRTVYDSVLKLGGLRNVDINRKMLSYAKGAYSKYRSAMEEKTTNETEEQRQRKMEQMEQKRNADELKKLALLKEEMKRKARDIDDRMTELKRKKTK